MDRKKLVFSLETPYSATPWPDVSFRNQETIIELLCSLLSPLGEWRRNFVRPSKGKRDRKRKRKGTEDGSSETDSHPPSPPRPEQSSYVDIGLASISRTLQEEASSPSTYPLLAPTNQILADSNGRHCYSAVFVVLGGQSFAFTSQFPRMVSIASSHRLSASAEYPVVHLVGLSEAVVQGKLSEALGIPRVSSVAILDNCPGSEALLNFVREHVPVVDIPWLRETQDGNYKEAKIKTLEVTIGAKKPARKTLPIYSSR